MKIALVGNTMFHQGAEYAMLALARGLAKRGHQVDIVLSRLQRELQQAHPDWKPFEMPPNARVLIQEYVRARFSIFSLRRLMKRNHYDVVMSHAGPYSIPLALAAVGLRRRPKLIHVEHSGGTGVDDDGNLVRPEKTLKTVLHNRLMRLFDAQCGVSQGTSDAIHRMTGFPKNRIFTVYNPVLDDVFDAKRKAAPDHPWLQDASVPVVVAAGSLEPNKCYDKLIRAFAEVTKRMDARLIVFGRGGEFGNYEKLANDLGVSDKVSLPGFTDNLPSALSRASCFVVSSIQESFSVVLVEALACGVPVVSTDCHYGPPEILKNGEYGVLVPVNDVQKMAEGILRVLKGDGIMPTTSMVAPYTVEAIVNRYEHVMDNIL